MRVAVCSFDFQHFYNGPNSWLRRLAPVWAHHGVEPIFWVFATPGAGPLIDALAEAGLSHAVYPWQSTTQQKVDWLIEQGNTFQPDIFLPNLAVPGCIAAPAFRDAGIPTVAILHTDDPFYQALYDCFVAGSPEHRLSGFVCVSEWQSAEFATPDGCMKARIPYGVQIPDRAAEPPDATLRLIYTGRFVQTQKRVRDVATALARATGEIPGVEATMLGEGEELPTVRSILASIPRSRVALPGAVDNCKITRHLLEHHAIVLLSDCEGLPISLLEGMACGLVPICLDLRSGAADLIRHGVSGLVVHDRAESFLEAVRLLQGNPERWSRLSHAARAAVTSRFGLEQTHTQWFEFFSRLLSIAQPRRAITSLAASLPPRHRDLACEDFRTPEEIVPPRFSSANFRQAGAANS